MNIKELVVPVADLAELFGVSERRIQQLVELGMPRLDRGKYNLFACVQWQLNEMEQSIETLKNSGDVDHLELKKEGQRLSNAERKVKLDVITGNLVSKDSVRYEWTAEVKSFKRALQTLHYRLVPALENATSNADMIEIIRREVDFVSNSLSEDLHIDESSDKSLYLEDLKNDAAI